MLLCTSTQLDSYPVHPSDEVRKLTLVKLSESLRRAAHASAPGGAWCLPAGTHLGQLARHRKWRVILVQMLGPAQNEKVTNLIRDVIAVDVPSQVSGRRAKG